MEFKDYSKSVFSIIWKDHDGYTYDLDALDRQLIVPFMNKVSVEAIANSLLKRHKRIMRLVEDTEQGNKSAQYELLKIVNTHSVVTFG